MCDLLLFAGPFYFRCGRKRDMIAYWANDDSRRTLFEAIRVHAAESGIKRLVVDWS